MSTESNPLELLKRSLRDLTTTFYFRERLSRFPANEFDISRSAGRYVRTQGQSNLGLPPLSLPGTAPKNQVTVIGISTQIAYSRHWSMLFKIAMHQQWKTLKTKIALI